MKETSRDRVTVAQSVNSLVYDHYVTKDKINPEYEKSKVVIRPTFLGKHCCVDFLKVNLEDILKAEDNEQISAFLAFIKDSHPYQREKLIKPLKELYFVLHASSGLLINNMPIGKDETIKDELKRALKTGISELVQDEDYDAKKLLNKRSIESLKKAFSSSEIKELRQSLRQMKKNIIATADRFPE
jgi:hypothetical protein